MTDVLTSGAAQRKELDRIRARIEQCNAEMTSLEDAARTPEEAANFLLDRISNDIGAVRHQLLSQQFFDGSEYPQNLGSLSVLAVLDPDDLRQRLIRLFRTEGEPGGVSQADRHAGIQKLKAQLLELHEREESATRDLEVAGFRIDRDPDPNFKSLLRIWDQRS